MAAPRSLMLVLALLGTLAVALMAWRMVEAPPESLSGRILTRAQPAPVSPPKVEAKVEAEVEAKQEAKQEPKPETKPSPPQLTAGWRLLPGGELLVAGTTAPGAKVTLLQEGQIVAEALAQATGDFVLLPPTLRPGETQLVLRAVSGAGAAQEQLVIAMPAPATPAANSSIASQSPSEAPLKPSSSEPATPLAASPKEPASEAPKGSGQVAITSAEAGGRSAFQASGTAPAGSRLRFYLNDTFVADVTASPKGAWSLKVERGMASGHYELRADVVDEAGKVSARAAVPFDYPEAPSEASSAPEVAQASPSAPIAPAMPSKPGEAVVPQIQSVRVVKGDSLWRISQRVLGDGQRYIQIYQANADQIRNPNLIYPGQILVTPQPSP